MFVLALSAFVSFILYCIIYYTVYSFYCCLLGHKSLGNMLSGSHLIESGLNWLDKMKYWWLPLIIKCNTTMHMYCNVMFMFCICHTFIVGHGKYLYGRACKSVPVALCNYNRITLNILWEDVNCPSRLFW